MKFIEEIRLKILEFLGPEELIKISLVNKEWHQSTNNDYIWFNLSKFPNRTDKNSFYIPKLPIVYLKNWKDFYLRFQRSIEMKVDDKFMAAPLRIMGNEVMYWEIKIVNKNDFSTNSSIKIGIINSKTNKIIGSKCVRAFNKKIKKRGSLPPKLYKHDFCGMRKYEKGDTISCFVYNCEFFMFVNGEPNCKFKIEENDTYYPCAEMEGTNSIITTNIKRKYIKSILKNFK
jgi:hypothetical protein